MSFNQNMATITVGDVTYDVETHSTNLGQKYTIQLDGEDVFEGLEGLCENEEYIESHDNPRNACNTGTMAISYRDYILGGDDDEDISQIDFEIDCENCGGEGEDPNGNWVVGIHYTADPLAVGSREECEAFLETLPEIETGRYYIEPFACPVCKGDCVVSVNPAEYFIKKNDARVVIGLFVYEHSGITISAGPRVGEVLQQSDVRSTGRFMGDDAGWDTSFVGFIYDTPKQVKETQGDDATDEQIEAALRQEVELYASYLEGDVCWYCVEDDETNFMESCGGFLGDHKECERQMYESLESGLVKRIAEEKERAYWLAREVVTI